MKSKTKVKKSSSSKYVIIGILILVAIIGLIFISNSGKKYSSKSLDDFAKCITENGAVMYGTFWCPHCAKTKKLFGSSFNYVKYIECDPRGDNEQSILCISKNIDKYDTWEFSDGTRILLEPTLEQLSQKTGCIVPQ